MRVPWRPLLPSAYGVHEIGIRLLVCMMLCIHIHGMHDTVSDRVDKTSSSSSPVVHVDKNSTGSLLMPAYSKTNCPITLASCTKLASEHAYGL